MLDEGVEDLVIGAYHRESVSVGAFLEVEVVNLRVDQVFKCAGGGIQKEDLTEIALNPL